MNYSTLLKYPLKVGIYLSDKMAPLIALSAAVGPKTGFKDNLENMILIPKAFYHLLRAYIDNTGIRDFFNSTVISSYELIHNVAKSAYDHPKETLAMVIAAYVGAKAPRFLKKRWDAFKIHRVKKKLKEKGLEDLASDIP